MKISVIMQVYLGDYPGARKDPQYKFVRAVNSFISQKHEDKELIIVSDGCEDSKELYQRLFSNNPQIKFAYLAKRGPKMYEVNDRRKYFRGLPRQVGRALADGDIITYMDGDDIILPFRLSNIDAAWSAAPQSMLWSFNTLCITMLVPSFSKSSAVAVDLGVYGYSIKEKPYACKTVPEGKLLRAPWAVCHRQSVSAVWKDTYDELDEAGNKIGGFSEDWAFVKSLQEESPGFRQDSASYVLCHSKDEWDF